MNRRRLLGVAGAASTAISTGLAGCTGSFDSPAAGQLSLTVQNERDAAIDVDVTVVDRDGTRYAEEEDRIDAGVARAFEFTVGQTGRHEAVVEGADYVGRLAWNAGECALFDGSVRVSDERVAVATECVQFR
jgi:hypothetical protein